MEYAVFQTVPNAASSLEAKKDKRQGTLEEDGEYQRFLASFVGTTEEPLTLRQDSTAADAQAPSTPSSQPQKTSTTPTTPWEASLLELEKREATSKYVRKIMSLLLNIFLVGVAFTRLCFYLGW